MHDIFGSFNEDVLPGYKDFPNWNLVANSLKKRELVWLSLSKKRNLDSKIIIFMAWLKMLCIDPIKRINDEGCLSHRLEIWM